MTDPNGKLRRPTRIYWIGGSKGGVGKSMMTVVTLDYLLERGEKVLLVECDTSNPDVWKAYEKHLDGELIELDEADGWIRLVNACDTTRSRVVVVNTAARNNVGVSQYGRTLEASLDELEAKLVAFWMINRQRDSLELLADFMEAMPKADVHVVRNGYFGEEAKFELYNASDLRKVVEARGGKSVTLPDLADRVADDIYSQAPDAQRRSQDAPHRQSRRARALARRSAQDARRGRVVTVEDDVRRRCVGRQPSEERAPSALPPARCARPSRQRRVLEHRDGARALRFVLPRVSGASSPRRRHDASRARAWRSPWRRRRRRRRCSGCSPRGSRRRASRSRASSRRGQWVCTG